MNEREDDRLAALSSILLVEHDVRRAEALNELFFIIANDTHRVTPYRFACVWEQDAAGQVQLVQASNVSELDPNAPMILWLKDLAAWLVQNSTGKPRVVVEPDAPDALRDPWQEFSAPYGLHLPVLSPGGQLLGGIFLSGAAPWRDRDIALLERLVDAYGHAWWTLRPSVTGDLKVHLKRFRKRYVIFGVVLLLLPVRQFVLVPAEVVPSDPFVVSAPMNGVVEGIDVPPNTPVSMGTLLFTLEDTDLANELIVAQKAFEVAEAEYLKNAQDAFACDSCRGQVPALHAQAEKARAEVDWARNQLERSKVIAPVDGVAVFSDPNEWRGRPVAVGERVMVLAQPDRTRLRIAMPVADAIAIEPGTDVVFYLNANPLSSFDARVLQTSYEANVQADQSLAYVLLADFADDAPRLGLRGTAKVYGDRAPILFHILRRPLAWLRRTLGV